MKSIRSFSLVQENGNMMSHNMKRKLPKMTGVKKMVLACQTFFLGFATLFGVAFTQSNATNTIELTLSNYIKLVEKKAPQIQMDRYDVTIAAANYHELRDSFSPMLTGSLSQTVGAQTNFAKVNTNREFSAGISKVFSETGTALSATISGKYNDRSVPRVSTSAFTGARADTWSANVGLSINQSLLRGGPIGFMGADSLYMLREQARLQRSVFNSKLGGQILTAMSAYWGYELNQKLLKLQSESIADARDLLEKNRRRVAVGTVDISDVYTSEVTLADSENAKGSLERDIENNKADLLFYMGYTNIRPENVSIKIQDNLVYKAIDLNEETLVETAKKHRKEFEQARIARDIARAALRQARFALLPKLDLTLSLTPVGYDTNNNSLGDAFTDLWKFNTNQMDFFAGLKFETPLDLGAYVTVVEKREAEYQKAQKNLQTVVDQLQMQIREHIRNLNYLSSVLDRTKDALGVSEQKVAELRRQFNNGKIDSTRFNIGYEGLRGIQKLYYSTLVQYEIEKCSLLLTQGIFLKDIGVKEEKITGWIR